MSFWLQLLIAISACLALTFLWMCALAYHIGYAFGCGLGKWKDRGAE